MLLRVEVPGLADEDDALVLEGPIEVALQIGVHLPAFHRDGGGLHPLDELHIGNGFRRRALACLRQVAAGDKSIFGLG
jgi:hypothetical protein